MPLRRPGSGQGGTWAAASERTRRSSFTSSSFLRRNSSTSAESGGRLQNATASFPFFSRGRVENTLRKTRRHAMPQMQNTSAPRRSFRQSWPGEEPSFKKVKRENHEYSIYDFTIEDHPLKEPSSMKPGFHATNYHAKYMRLLKTLPRRSRGHAKLGNARVVFCQLPFRHLLVLADEGRVQVRQDLLTTSSH